MPISGGTTTPGGRASRLVAEVSADDPRVAGVTPYDTLPVSDPTALRVLRVVPERIAISIAATPLRTAVVIVQNYHDSRIGKSAYHLVEHGQRVLALHVGIRGKRVFRDNRITLIQLVRPGESHGIEAQTLDLIDDTLQGGGLQSAHYVVRGLSAVPVHSIQANALGATVHEVGACGVQGKCGLGCAQPSAAQEGDGNREAAA